MNTQRSSVALRCLIVATLSSDPGDSLVGLNTHELPDGALVYVTATGAEYRLDKSLSAPAITPFTVAPSAGPGLFVKQIAAADYTQEVTGTGNFHNTNTGGLTLDTWSALPSVTGAYGASFASSAWSLNTTTGILTYNGPSGKRILFEQVLSLSETLSASPFYNYEVTMTKNGVLLATTTADPSASGVSLNSAAAVVAPVPQNEIFTANEGDTFQSLIRCLTSAVGVPLFSRYTLIATEV